MYGSEMMQMGSQANLHSTTLTRNHASSLWLRFGFWMSIVIAVAIVVRRVLALVFPSPNLPPQMAALDSAFASHAVLTLAHILPALAFVLDRKSTRLNSSHLGIS